ncbi:MAG: dipeptidase [Steroidobacteraceae bacterium]
MGKLTRRAVIASGAAGVAAVAAGSAFWWSQRKPPLGMEIPGEFLRRGVALLAEFPSVDVHSHPGRSFLVGAHPDSFVIRLMRDGFEASRIADMQRAHVTASLFSMVADFPLLSLEGGGLHAAREFAEGEALRDYQRQLARLRSLVAEGLIRPGLAPGDIRAAHRAGERVAVLCSEGGDFIDDRLERLADAYAAGLRSITLVHYHVNRLGDVQTVAPVHHGLTAFGGDVVREMNRLGMIVDVAHATYETCAGAIEASRAPVMLSHSSLAVGPAPSPRLISKEHARLVAGAGGIIGAWPAGIGSASLADFVGQVLALVDAVGIEHVAIGTDMDANYKPVLTEYADFPVLAAALLTRGMREADVAKVLGGNFLRLFDEVVAVREGPRSPG